MPSFWIYLQNVCKSTTTTTTTQNHKGNSVKPSDTPEIIVMIDAGFHYKVKMTYAKFKT